MSHGGVRAAKEHLSRNEVEASSGRLFDTIHEQTSDMILVVPATLRIFFVISRRPLSGSWRGLLTHLPRPIPAALIRHGDIGSCQTRLCWTGGLAALGRRPTQRHPADSRDVRSLSQSLVE